MSRATELLVVDTHSLLGVLDEYSQAQRHPRLFLTPPASLIRAIASQPVLAPRSYAS